MSQSVTTVHHWPAGASPASDAYIVIARGELDLGALFDVQAAIGAALRARPDAIVIDLTEVTFIDSTGLATLLNALRRATRAKIALSLVCVNPTVLRVFERTRLRDTFRIFETRSAAVAARLRRRPAHVSPRTQTRSAGSSGRGSAGARVTGVTSPRPDSSALS